MYAWGWVEWLWARDGATALAVVAVVLSPVLFAGVYIASVLFVKGFREGVQRGYRGRDAHAGEGDHPGRRGPEAD